MINSTHVAFGRKDLAAGQPIAAALLSIMHDDRRRRRLTSLGLEGFRPVGSEYYEEERCEMRALGLIV